MARVATGELTSLAVRVLRHEAAAISEAAERLSGDQLERAAEIFLDRPGKLVLLGTGKSGIAGRKIAATLTSTGTAAIFLHPVDALHGDIGMVSSDDCAIAISKSGESEELIAVLTHLKRRGVRIVAIVGNLDSSIARQADASIDASVDEEACPLNLAPTTSTTLAIAIGDALAAVLMTAKGFTAEDFALNHPGGRLGKRLTLRVSDLMHAGEDNPTIPETASLMTVVEAVTRGGLGAANIVDTANRLVGIVTDGDLRRALQRSGFAGLDRIQAADIMTTSPTVVFEDSLAYDALRLMEDRPSQISVLPVVDVERRCLGLLRLHDVVQAGLS
jgi:arabinose-5-phosphate isomerase